MKESKKEKVPIWMYPEMIKQIDAAYPLHEISSRSEFVCKDVETWDIVQDIRKHKRRRANMAEQNMFDSLRETAANSVHAAHPSEKQRRSPT